VAAHFSYLRHLAVLTSAPKSNQRILFREDQQVFPILSPAAFQALTSAASSPERSLPPPRQGRYPGITPSSYHADLADPAKDLTVALPKT